MEFVVRARLIERRGTVVVRDETRLDSASSLGDAVRTARAYVAGGFTVRVYEVCRDNAVRPTYVSVDTFSPDAGLSPDRCDRRGPRGAGPGSRR